MARTYSPTGSQPPSVELTVRQGPQPGQCFSLTQSTIIIGREAGSDVTVNDRQVSRRHASLTWDGRQFIIQDLGSANGTFVNGIRLTASQVLQQGDVISLGQTVLLAFRASSPAASPSDTLPSAGPGTGGTGPVVPPPAYAPRPPKRGRRILAPLIALLGLCCLLAVGAGLGYYFLRPRDVTGPMVSIRSPRHREQVEVGQEMTIHSIARDEGKVTRVELWIDGQLHETQTSTLPGGTSPFPLLARWQPSSPGTHTLIARAFNARGGRGQASVNVEAVVRADRDGDDIPDAEDDCPDEPGLLESNGCPVSTEIDRDGDGILDEADVCLDEAGPPSADGCPDADGDRVRDSEDDCPDEPGLPEHDGCPTPGDLDGDGVPDAEDACADEPGLSEHTGCPDGDGDGVRDMDDACPDEPGLSGLAGCPDQDGDGIPDRQDACPDEPGLGPSGCPETGFVDRDGDGIPDDADLCPDEPGPGPSGCQPPGDGEDADGDGIPDTERPADTPWDVLDPLWPPGGFFGPLGPGDDVRIMVPVEFQALEFEVYQDYDEVHCYAGLAGEEMERYGPFEPLGGRQWDIAEHLGGENSRHLAVPLGESLEVQVECAGEEIFLGPEGGWGTYWDLGSFIQHHPPSDWDGHVISVGSAGGEEEHSFQARYRICADSCEEAAYPPPILSLFHVGGVHQLVWLWGGDRESVNGFKVYLNDNFDRGLRKDISSYTLQGHEPACGERWEFQMTAYSGPTLVPERESPPSNSVYWTGPPCPRVVRVAFNQLNTYDLRDARRMEGNLGPIFGSFYAQGSNSESLYFDGADYPDGYLLRPYATHNIRDIFNWILGEMSHLCSPTVCPLYTAPEVNYVTVELGPGDDLTIGGVIYDQDWRVYQTVFNGFYTIPADEIVSGPIQIRDQQIELTAYITLVSGP
jgi:pSer/pThr/pTyr-binding forkhead associated (FHA) protein